MKYLLNRMRALRRADIEGGLARIVGGRSAPGQWLDFGGILVYFASHEKWQVGSKPRNVKIIEKKDA